MKPFVAISCEQVDKQVIAYLKHGLPAANQEAIRQHLLTCPHCTQTIQEARTLERELRLTARHGRPQLSEAASTQIQLQIYRRMRRALLLQRTRFFAERMMAVGLGLVMVLFFTFVGRPWLNYLAVPTLPAPPAATSPPHSPLPTQPRPTPRPLPTPTSQPLRIQPPTTSPAESMNQLFRAALDGDNGYLEAMMPYTRPEITQRIWSKVARCSGRLTPADFQYRIMDHWQHLVSIYIFQDNFYIGDLKMAPQPDGQWQIIYFNYVSFTPLIPLCPP